MSDTLRRRIAAGLLIVGVIVAVLAIEDVGPFSDPETEEERVQAAVEQFFGAPPTATRGRSAACSPATRVRRCA